MTGDCHVRFCEGLGVKFPGATRRRTKGRSVETLRELARVLRVQMDSLAEERND
jgi:hypothetical protein